MVSRSHKPLHSGIFLNGNTLWTGVSVNANAEADCSDTINGVKDWLNALETALAMPCTMVAYGLAGDRC